MEMLQFLNFVYTGYTKISSNIVSISSQRSSQKTFLEAGTALKGVDTDDTGSIKYLSG